MTHKVPVKTVKKQMALTSSATPITHKLVYEGADVVIFEGGWWMKQTDRRALWIDEYGNQRTHARTDLGISRDEETKQLKLFIVPSSLPLKINKKKV